MLQLRFFGSPVVSLNDRPLPALTGSPILTSLLAFLALHRDRPHSRSVLAALFWPDLPESRARRYLNTHLWRLRSLLHASPDAPSPYLLCDGQTARFNPAAPHSLDVAEFEAATALLRRASALPADPGEEVVRSLERAVDLYRGDLLDGVYADWSLGLRERLRERYLTALEVLTRAYRKRGWHEAAQRVARRLVQADPWREAGHHQLVELCLLLDRPHEARAQYHRYEAIWHDELRLSPSTRMAALGHRLGPDDLLSADPTSAADLYLLEQASRFSAGGAHEPLEPEEQKLLDTMRQQVADSAARLGQSLKARCANAPALAYLTLALEALASLPESAERWQRELVLRQACDELHDMNADRRRQAENLRLAEGLAARLNDSEGQVDVLARRGWMEMRRGQHGEAVSCLRPALAVCQAGSHRRLEALVCRLMGIAGDETGDFTAAHDWHARALGLDESGGQLDAIPTDLNNLASCEIALARYPAALANLERGLGLLTPESAPLIRATVMGNLGNVWTKLGDYPRAADYLAEALALARRIGDREAECWVGGQLATLYHRRGESERGLMLAGLHYRAAEEIGTPMRTAELSVLLAHLAREAGDGESGLVWADRAAELARGGGFGRYEVCSEMRRAQSLLVLRQPDRAFAGAHHAVQAFERRGQPLEEGPELYHTLTACARAVGQETVAEQASARARRTLSAQAHGIADDELRECFLAHHPCAM